MSSNGFKGAARVAASVQPQDEPKEREPTIARRSPFAPATKLCPKCLAPLKGTGGIGGWLVPMNYHCPKCGYTGTVYFEKENQPDERKG